MAIVHQEGKLWHSIGVTGGEVVIQVDNLFLLSWSGIVLVWGFWWTIAELKMRG
jgi:hypothetical protein